VLERDRPHLGTDLRWSPAAHEWRLAHILRRELPYRSTAEIDQAVQVTRAMLRASARLAHSRGCAFLIVAPILEPETPQERVLRRRVLDEGGFDYVAVVIPAEWRVPGDQHPDVRGARAMAQAITAALKARLAAADPKG
jgi:hypothetical protein